MKKGVSGSFTGVVELTYESESHGAVRAVGNGTAGDSSAVRAYGDGTAGNSSAVKAGGDGTAGDNSIVMARGKITIGSNSVGVKVNKKGEIVEVCINTDRDLVVRKENMDRVVF